MACCVHAASGAVGGGRSLGGDVEEEAAAVPFFTFKRERDLEQHEQQQVGR